MPHEVAGHPKCPSNRNGPLLRLLSRMPARFIDAPATVTRIASVVSESRSQRLIDFAF